MHVNAAPLNYLVALIPASMILFLSIWRISQLEIEACLKRKVAKSLRFRHL